MKLLYCLSICLLLSVSPLRSGQNANPASDIWVTAYLTAWELNMGSNTNGNYGTLPVGNLDWSAFTDLILFNILPNSTGNLNYDNVVTSRRKPFTDIAHAHGKPVLVALGGWGATQWNAACTEPALTNFINNVLKLIDVDGFDGIDMDVEPFGNSGTNDTAHVGPFLRRLYDSLQTRTNIYTGTGKPKLTAAILPGWAGAFWVKHEAIMDQINIMTYDMGNSLGFGVDRTWHNNGIFCPTPYSYSSGTNRYYESVQKRYDGYVSAKGGSPAKTGIGIDFNGVLYKGGRSASKPDQGVSTPAEIWSTAPTITWDYNFNQMFPAFLDTATSASMRYDSANQGAYLSIVKPASQASDPSMPWLDDMILSYTDSAQIQRLIRFVRDSSAGGVILWNIGEGYLPSQYQNRDRMLQYVKTAVGNIAVPPPPPPPPVATDTIPPSLNVLTPSPGATVSSQVTISATATDAAGIAGIRFYLDGAPLGTEITIAPFSVQWNSSTVANGVHTLRVVARDVSNLTTAQQFDVTVNNDTASGGNPATLQAVPVFDDALRTPWINASWSSTNTYGSTERSYAGATSVKADQSAWGAISVHSGNWAQSVPWNLSPEDSLKFAVYPVTSGLSLLIALENDQNQAFSSLVRSALPVNQWSVLSIPISQLNPNNNAIHRIVIQNNTSSLKQYFMDELQFIGPQAGQAALAAPTLLQPSDGASIPDLNVALSWSPDSATARYHLQLATDDAWRNIVLEDTSIQGTTYQLTSLTAGIRYYWRVKVNVGTSGSVFSPARSFTSTLETATVKYDRIFVDFGQVGIGSTTTDSINVSNQTDRNVTIQEIRTTSGSFVATMINNNLAPGGKERIYVNFKPSKKGTVTAVVVSLADSVVRLDTIRLSGQGVSQPRSSRTRGSIAFTGIPVEAEVVDTFSVANDGELDLVISDVTSSSDAVTVWPKSAVIAGGENRVFQLKIRPSKSGDGEAFVVFQQNTSGGVDTMRVSYTATATGAGAEIPAAYVLNQNYPNPFNPSTSISFGLPVESNVSIRIYNALGSEVADLRSGVLPAGYHTLTWDGRNSSGEQVTSGTYFLRMDARGPNDGGGGISRVMKMLLVK